MWPFKERMSQKADFFFISSSQDLSLGKKEMVGCFETLTFFHL